ncbi:MAG: invasion associated locus B family protein, partial [Proteobacteria bacterium]|nr:invasion associated locus B family protein [Pseudomonadota bacterium]
LLMQKTLLTFIFIFFANISNNLFALEKGSWTLTTDNDWCYIGSLPIKSDLPETKKRGENYILVYKIIGSDQNIVQVEAGYQYNLDKDIIVKIDNTSFDFYSTEDSSETAWTDNDEKVIYAMKKGLELVLIGQSNRGTMTKDTYTLKGFTSALNKLNEDC